MAYFRAGGAGIPSSLKSGMNQVLNKKFGTSTTYPPTDWPDTVNLMGPLPEKTVSGAIASFSDGADDVPIKSASFGIVASGGGGTPSAPVPIVGKSSVTVYQTGKNFIDFSNNLTSGTSGGFTFSKASNGGISFSGTATGTFAYITPKFDFKIPSGKQFTLSRDTAFSFRHYVQLTFSDNTTASVIIGANETSVTYTPAKDVIAVRLIMSQLTEQTAYSGTVYIQIEFNSSATAYEPYKSKTPITVSLGQTVYGGTIASDGTLTINTVIFSYNSGVQYYGEYAGHPLYYVLVPEDYTALIKQYGATTDNAILLSNMFVKNTGANVGALGDLECRTNQGASVLRFYFRYDSATGATEINGLIENTPLQFVCELKTPIVITGLDEISINTYLGDNNIWCDSGDSEVTYREDIQLALNS